MALEKSWRSFGVTDSDGTHRAWCDLEDHLKNDLTTATNTHRPGRVTIFQLPGPLLRGFGLPSEFKVGRLYVLGTHAAPAAPKILCRFAEYAEGTFLQLALAKHGAALLNSVEVFPDVDTKELALFDARDMEEIQRLAAPFKAAP